MDRKLMAVAGVVAIIVVAGILVYTVLPDDSGTCNKMTFNGEEYTWTFRTETKPLIDTVPPSILSYSPSNNSTVTISANIKVTFSEPINSSSLDFTLRGSDQAIIPYSYEYDQANNTHILAPAQLKIV